MLSIPVTSLCKYDFLIIASTSVSFNHSAVLLSAVEVAYLALHIFTSISAIVFIFNFVTKYCHLSNNLASNSSRRILKYCIHCHHACFNHIILHIKCAYLKISVSS